VELPPGGGATISIGDVLERTIVPEPVVSTAVVPDRLIVPVPGRMIVLEPVVRIVPALRERTVPLGISEGFRTRVPLVRDIPEERRPAPVESVAPPPAFKVPEVRMGEIDPEITGLPKLSVPPSDVPRVSPPPSPPLLRVIVPPVVVEPV
jgi:hypothetical protein